MGRFVRHLLMGMLYFRFVCIKQNPRELLGPLVGCHDPSGGARYCRLCGSHPSIWNVLWSAVLQLFVALYLTKCTGELRQKIGGAPDFVGDLLKWGFCQCCTVVQWQRQMDEIKGDRVMCPMGLEDSAKAREVGDAFGVEPLLA